MGDALNRRDQIGRTTVFVICLLLSAAWSSAALGTGGAINEPFVAYLACQLILGFVSGFLVPRSIWHSWLGTILGQEIVFVVGGGLGGSSTAAIAVVLLPIFCIPTLIGAAMGACVNRVKL